jgi:hypothetical protein
MCQACCLAAIVSQFVATSSLASDTQSPRGRTERANQAATAKVMVVGQIYVVGNESTPQGTILRREPLYPGKKFTKADLQVAERKLARLWCYVFAKDDERPSVMILDGDDGSGVRDILIIVHEGPQTVCLWRLVDLGEAALDIRCQHLVFGHLALVPGAPHRITLVSYCLGDAAYSWFKGDDEQTKRAIDFLLWSPWGLFPFSTGWPENPAPPS